MTSLLPVYKDDIPCARADYPPQVDSIEFLGKVHDGIVSPFCHLHHPELIPMLQPTNIAIMRAPMAALRSSITNPSFSSTTLLKSPPPRALLGCSTRQLPALPPPLAVVPTRPLLPIPPTPIAATSRNSYHSRARRRRLE